MSSLSEVIRHVEAVLGSDDDRWSFEISWQNVEEVKECQTPAELQKWHERKLKWMNDQKDPDVLRNLELYLNLFESIIKPLGEVLAKIEDLRGWARGASNTDNTVGRSILREVFKGELLALRAFVTVAEHPDLMQKIASGIVRHYLKMTMEITKDSLRVVYPQGPDVQWLDYWDESHRDGGYDEFIFNREESRLREEDLVLNETALAYVIVGIMQKEEKETPEGLFELPGGT